MILLLMTLLENLWGCFSLLFVSRYCGKIGFAVKDTDDGVEECHIRGANLVFDMIRQNNLDVKGVVPGFDEFKMDDLSDAVCVVPYQEESTILPIQGKISTAYGIKVTLCDKMLTNVIWRHSVPGVVASLRLSDFCNSVADNIFRGNTSDGELKLTLALDDGIESSSHLAFSPFYPSDIDKVFIDISGVMNIHLVHSVYSSVYAGARSNMAITMIQRVIIDKQDRKKQFVEKYLQMRGA